MSNKTFWEDTTDFPINKGFLSRVPELVTNPILEWVSAASVRVKGSNGFPLNVGSSETYWLDTDVTLDWGDIDTGSEAPSTWYYVYICNDGSTTPIFLISTSSSAPSGYTTSDSKQIGKFYNDASGDVDAGSLIDISQTYEKIKMQNALISGRVKLATLANINDIFVYDTTKDKDGGAWTCDANAQGSSWYNETLNDTDRGATRAFPKRAVLVATDDYLYIYDAKDNSMWMRFNVGINEMVSPAVLWTTLGLNGKIYASSEAGHQGISFISDSGFSQIVTGFYTYKGTIEQRNAGLATVHTKPSYQIVNTSVNDVHAAVIAGKTFVAVATDGGATGCVSLINETDEVVYDLGTANDHANAVWLTCDGTLYILNETKAQVEVFYFVQNISTDDQTPDVTYDESSTPALWPSTPTVNVAPDALRVIEGGSFIDGKSNKIFVCLNEGAVCINEKQGDETNGSIKPYTKDFIGEDQIGDIRSAWPFYETTINDGTTIDDVSVRGADLQSVNGATSASGVRGTAFDFNGSDEYLKQKVRDTNQGTVTYNGNNLDDDGQDFADWETSAPGTAAYMVIVVDDDSHVSWGYLGDKVDATEINVYDDIGLTSAGWNGDGGTGTPATYEVRDTDFQITGNLTVGMWVNVDEATSSTFIHKLSGNFGYHLFTDAADDLSFSIGDGTDVVTVEFTIDLTENAWHFIAGVYDGTNVNLYLDGISVGTPAAQSAPGDLYVSLQMGYDGTNYCDGTMDGPFVEAEAESAAQIKHRYEVGKRALENHTANRVDSIAPDDYQKLQGTSNIVKAVAVDEQAKMVYIGTNDGSDGGAVTQLGLEDDTVHDQWINGVGLIDEDGVAWNADDIVTVSVSSIQRGNQTGRGLLAIGTDTEHWIDSPDLSVLELLEHAANTSEILQGKKGAYLGDRWVSPRGDIFRWMRNTSGGALAATDAVVWDLSADDGFSVTTVAIANVAYGVGVIGQIIDDYECGWVQTGGLCVSKQDGSGVGITAGDALGTIATAKKLGKTTVAGAKMGIAYNNVAADTTDWMILTGF